MVHFVEKVDAPGLRADIGAAIVASILQPAVPCPARSSMYLPPKLGQSLQSHILRGYLLHEFATLVIVAVSCSQTISHVFANDLAKHPSRPNIVLILADDKY
jgi:hypothetical protein